MKRIFNLILIAGVTIFSYSCAETTEPTSVEILVGSWEVVDQFADFQGVDGDGYNRFVLERDGSFVLTVQDQDELIRGRANSWSSTATSLTLNAETGQQIVFEIVYQDFDKMQLDQVLSLPSGSVRVTYLLVRDTSDSGFD